MLRIATFLSLCLSLPAYAHHGGTHGIATDPASLAVVLGAILFAVLGARLAARRQAKVTKSN